MKIQNTPILRPQKKHFIYLFFLILNLFYTSVHLRASDQEGQSCLGLPQVEQDWVRLSTAYLKVHETICIFRLKSGSSLAELFRTKNLVDSSELFGVLSGLSRFLNLRRVQPGMEVKVTYHNQIVHQVALQLSREDSVQLLRLAPGWSIGLIENHIERRKITYSGIVESSLWESADKTGMDPQLIVELAEVFAWQLDFSRELRPKDRWRIVVNQIFVNGKRIGYGPILAAEFVNRGETYSAVRFEHAPGRFDYFSPDGQSLKRMFLKSPIKFARISSRFSKRRFHPVLKRYRPHNGVDYSAPPGTPVLAVGSGRVTLAGRRGGSGIMVKIRHNATYQTAYLHLRALAKGVRRGRRVEQGQVVGYVGSTGLATGPHLHFSFYQNGRYIDPLGRKFPSKDPVPKSLLASFGKISSDRLAMLPAWERFSGSVQPKG